MATAARKILDDLVGEIEEAHFPILIVDVDVEPAAPVDPIPSLHGYAQAKP